MESNGIAMQEAMAVGLPVIAVRWGGPAMLADDTAAIYIEPNGEEQVVNDIAAAMNRLAENGDYADAISAKARTIAEQRFAWDVVARSWQAAYEECQPQAADQR
jgi:glycosyltransferase involved in cell wall biosynthesis